MRIRERQKKAAHRRQKSCFQIQKSIVSSVPETFRVPASGIHSPKALG